MGLMGERMSELKPCPFCGGEAILDDDQISDWPREYWGECLQCGATGHKTEDRQKAIDAWNRRSN